MVSQHTNIFCTLLLLLQCLIFANAYSIHSSGIDNSVDHNYSTGPHHITIHNFSPRLDNNNAWRPVGRGDPLKNDPTYDYSPPTLDRVRYWAETNNTVSDKTHKINTPENYVVADRIGNIGFIRKGVTTERVYNNNNNNMQQKNAKGEIPLLQPKYMAMRRNYYAQAPPTHLLPPPMHAMKLNVHEYNHNMQNYMPNSTATYMKHNPSTTAWMESVQPMQNKRTATSTTYDTHFQESVNYMQFARPSTMSHANAIRSSSNALKQSSPPRKPWLHELLQKEVVKTSKPIGISTTFAPLSTIPDAITTTTTSTTTTTTTAAAAPTTMRAQPETTTVKNMQFMYTTSTTAMPLNRLLIPNTSNMMQRPTVAPLRMTTDSLFKNYNQANLPLTGPMYLIIEGHSKVKTYGKDELDPHKPKIVPVIPKREPVVRVADPNEKRGTIETFQVKHLHTNSYKTTTPVSIIESSTTTTELPSSSSMMPMTKMLENNATITDNASSMQSGAQSLLNLLDSFFGADTETTTIASTKLQMVSMNTSTEKPIDLAQNLTADNSVRGVRQVYDYDQLPELRLKEIDLQHKDSSDVDDDDDLHDNASLSEEYEASKEEQQDNAEKEKLSHRIDSLIKDVEVESAQDELDELLSLEDESDALSMSRKT